MEEGKEMMGLTKKSTRGGGRRGEEGERGGG